MSWQRKIAAFLVGPALAYFLIRTAFRLLGFMDTTPEWAANRPTEDPQEGPAPIVRINEAPLPVLRGRLGELGRTAREAKENAVAVALWDAEAALRKDDCTGARVAFARAEQSLGETSLVARDVAELRPSFDRICPIPDEP